MNKAKRIKQLELENFNLKNRMKALEQRLFILEAKQVDTLPHYHTGTPYSQIDDKWFYPVTATNGVQKY